jgi:subtilisin family serine protease
MKRPTVLLAVLSVSLAARAGAAAPQEYLLRLKSSSALDAVRRAHGLTVVRTIEPLQITVVTGPPVSAATLESRVRRDRRVKSFERDHVFRNGATVSSHPDLRQTTAVLEQALAVDRTAAPFYGAPAWTGYVHQDAFALIDLEATHAAGTTGRGVVVAVIDSGIDERHPLLQGAILDGGYDFTRDTPDASEWKDLDQSTAFILDDGSCRPVPADGETVQSTAFILDGGCRPGVLVQSTAFILDDDTTRALEAAPPLPPAFGHGTMVAGLIHRVAPEARILPLKAFSADGTGRSSDIAAAIRYAVEKGAHVINMSFTLPVVSEEVLSATTFAAQSRVVLVASSGNDGRQTRAWPAEHRHVMGVAATTLDDRRALFSNHGFDTANVAAPGVDLVTTFPGGRYAAVSGTSFSAALVSGTAALMYEAAPLLEWSATREVCSEAPFDPVFGLWSGGDDDDDGDDGDDDDGDDDDDEDGADLMRILVPTATEYAVRFQRERTKSLKNAR